MVFHLSRTIVAPSDQLLLQDNQAATHKVSLLYTERGIVFKLHIYRQPELIMAWLMIFNVPRS